MKNTCHLIADNFASDRRIVKINVFLIIRSLAFHWYIKGMDISSILELQWIFFGRGVAQLIPLNMANLNNGQIHRKEYLRAILQLGMRSLSFLRNSIRCTKIAMTVF